jgi:hypothetical protein
VFLYGNGKPQLRVPTAASGLFAILVGGCTGETLPFTDEAHLAGTYRCSALGLDALWDSRGRGA